MTDSSLQVSRPIATSNRVSLLVAYSDNAMKKTIEVKTKKQPQHRFCLQTKRRCLQFVVSFCLGALSVLVLWPRNCAFLGLHFVAG